MLLPRRSNARLVRMLMVPAGESASTSALVVLDISIESMPANANPSKLTARELPAPPLAFAPGRLSPSRVTPVMDDGRPRHCTLVTTSHAPLHCTRVESGN